jgi:mRNA interferase YafQ
MRKLERTNKFKRDYKREKRTEATLDQILLPIIQMLAMDSELPVRLRDHALSGNWSGYRDCHIKPDLVLVYAKTPGTLQLVRLGSHAELFE